MSSVGEHRSSCCYTPERHPLSACAGTSEVCGCSHGRGAVRMSDADGAGGVLLVANFSGLCAVVTDRDKVEPHRPCLVDMAVQPAAGWRTLVLRPTAHLFDGALVDMAMYVVDYVAGSTCVAYGADERFEFAFLGERLLRDEGAGMRLLGGPGGYLGPNFIVLK